MAAASQASPARSCGGGRRWVQCSVEATGFRGVRGASSDDGAGCVGSRGSYLQYNGGSGIFGLNLLKVAAMPTDEDDQDGHFFLNHPERRGYPAA